MKWIRTATTPPAFDSWRADNPTATWNEFRQANRTGYDHMKAALVTAQRGLCAYCERSIAAGPATQIEHWHERHWLGGAALALDPANFRGACDGGERADDRGGARLAGETMPENAHCGQSKSAVGNSSFVPALLDARNGVNIPRVPPIWRIDGSGAIAVDEQACARLGIDTNVAKNTLKALGLDCPTLRRLRAETWLWLLNETGRDGQDLASLCDYLAPKPGGSLTEFWTTVRAFLGAVGEDWLTQHTGVW